MRWCSLLASLAVVSLTQISLAEPYTFAPACANSACPHPVTVPPSVTIQEIGPELLAPVVNSANDAVAPTVIRDFNIRVASNEAVSTTKTDKSELLQQKLVEAARLQGEIEKLRAELGQGQQILLKVRAIEVSLTKLRDLGTEISTANGKNVAVTDSSSLRKAIEASGSSSVARPYTKDSGSPNTFIDGLIANNVARVLAEPSIVTLSGRPAQFFCGSEIPLPGHDKNAAVDFRRCGTEVDVLAISTGNNRVRLDVRARVSDCNFGQSVRVGDSSLPVLRTRQCDTAVETTFGQPVVLDGAVEKRYETIKSESGTRDVENEIALLFVVTPELVESPGAIASDNVVRPARATQTK